MAANIVHPPKRHLWHPTWLIPFIVLCISAGIYGCLAVLERL
jgi:hypothetical protein